MSYYTFCSKYIKFTANHLRANDGPTRRDHEIVTTLKSLPITKAINTATIVRNKRYLILIKSLLSQLSKANYRNGHHYSTHHQLTLLFVVAYCPPIGVIKYRVSNKRKAIAKIVLISQIFRELFRFTYYHKYSNSKKDDTAAYV